MAEYDNEAMRLHEEGLTYEEIGQRMGLTFKQVNHALTRVRKQRKGEDQETENINETILKDLQAGKTKTELCKSLNISKRMLEAALDELREGGFLINDDGENVKLQKTIPFQDNIHEEPWNGEKLIRFGLCGDNQSGSRYTQHTHLHSLYDVFQREGIETVYHSGDMFEGIKMRPGHEYEIHCYGVDDNVEFAARSYPKRKGIKTKFISGNHCHSFIKSSGCDIGALLAAQRDDLEYLGMSSALVNLTPNCKLELVHPLDGTAYAISYKIQKMIDSYHGGEKPNILAVGHYHKAEYLFYRNIYAYQTGTTQAQTPWMKGKQLAAHVGGWIVEVYVDGDGTITRSKGEFIPFYTMIKDDWKNWQ